MDNKEPAEKMRSKKNAREQGETLKEHGDGEAEKYGGSKPGPHAEGGEACEGCRASGKKGEGENHEGCSGACLEEKISSLSGQLLRLQAEFDNYKKRTAKEKDALSTQSEAKVMLRLLPIYEELGMAEEEAKKVKDAAVREGIVIVLSKLRLAFSKEGLQEMELEGRKFDPFRHETAMREDSDLPEGTIVRVIQNGYLFKGEMLRHAIVSVSSGKRPEQQKEEKNSG